MKKGKVVAIHIVRKKGLLPQALQSVVAVGGMGLEGDCHAAPDSERQILAVDAEILEEFDLKAGDIKENITFSGIGIQTLEKGARVRVGKAIFEVLYPCKPCDYLGRFSPGLEERMRGMRGIFLRVLEGGLVKVGDEVIKL